MISREIPNGFQRALRTWFRKYGRDLPWRRTRDPYAVLVSEFMLQQTTVAAVIPYFQRWMEKFPNVSTLAGAHEQEVLQLWQGLGYYSRARNLHRAARQIVETHGGKIPSDIVSLRKLPGIGPYTAAAIVAFAFNECVPVLDVNIIRVVARLFNYYHPIGTTEGRTFLEQASRLLLPKSGGSAHVSALMDLGASICQSGKPKCAICPVVDFCKAKNPAAIPLKPARADVIRETEYRSFAQKSGAVYLVPSTGPRWKGLWILPSGRPARSPIAKLFYTVTRHRVQLEVAKVRPLKKWTAFSINDLPPMPTPHRRALDKILLEVARDKVKV